MAKVKLNELIVGNIYVTKGGLLTFATGEQFPWGYDRVKFIKYTEQGILVHTPWGSECALAPDYPLFETKETLIRSEFPLRGVHETRETIPFDKALELKICKELSKKEVRKQLHNANTSISTNTVQNKQTPSKSKTGEVATDIFTQDFIKYFEDYKTLAEAAKHFKISYQKVRYTLKKIKNKGYQTNRFSIVKMKQKGKTASKIIKV